MTPRQRQLLDFVLAYTKEHRVRPSYSEMCKAIGVKSKSTIHHLLQRMEADGTIEKPKGTTRDFKVRSEETAEEHLREVLAAVKTSQLRGSHVVRRATAYLERRGPQMARPVQPYAGAE